MHNRLLIKNGAYVTDAASLFINAAAITNTTQQSAIRTLVTNLKDSGIWNKIYAFYPIIGGNSYSHSFNLINIDAYRLNFNGTVNHGPSGMSGNGSNGYADTNLSPNIVFGPTGDASTMVYSVTKTGTNGTCLMGVYDNSAGGTSPSGIDLIRCDVPFSKNYGSMRNLYFQNVLTANDAGFHGSTIQTVGLTCTGIRWIGLTAAQTVTKTASNTLAWPPIDRTPSVTLTLMAQRAYPANTIANYNNETIGAVGLFQFLTGSEMNTLKSIIDTFQTTLGRNV